MNVNIETVARTLYGEARGQGLLDQLGVLAVIRERAMRPGWWGRTWEGVCRHPWQFSCWHGEHDDAHRRNYEAMMRAETDAPHTWDRMIQLASYAHSHFTDRDVMQLFDVDTSEEFPTHYHDRSIGTPAAWGDNITEIVPPWRSDFRWYVVRDGRPPRRVA